MREYQLDKVDIVHKYNAEQCKLLINNKEISDTLISAYNKSNLNTINNTNDADIIFDDLQIEDCKKKDNDYNNIYITKYSDDDEGDDEEGEDDIDDI
jgi:hypothetical protein